MRAPEARAGAMRRAVGVPRSARSSTTELPESVFLDPVWHALQTQHRHFSIAAGDACRYPCAVAPFAAVRARTQAALQDLRHLLAEGESAWLFGNDFPQAPGLCVESTLACLQMALPAEVQVPGRCTAPVELKAADAAAMLALTELAFPGFFRARAAEMGTYYGIRVAGELIAMGGERLILDGYAEISGICTHPAERGKGFGASIIWQLVQKHRRDGIMSIRHVSAANTRAVQLYSRMGFDVVRALTLSCIARSG